MAHPRLRVFSGPDALENESPATLPMQSTTVTVPLGEILSTLVDAVRSRRTWVGDFEDDKVTITRDLYEILMAYERFRRPSA